jgi:hypothetical protein
MHYDVQYVTEHILDGRAGGVARFTDPAPPRARQCSPASHTAGSRGRRHRRRRAGIVGRRPFGLTPVPVRRSAGP